jgi:hypothetical protein
MTITVTTPRRRDGEVRVLSRGWSMSPAYLSPGMQSGSGLRNEQRRG